MKKKITFHAIAFLMALLSLSACTSGTGDRRDRNLKQAVMSRADSLTDVRYVSKSDMRVLDENRILI